VCRVYDILDDDARMRALLTMREAERSAYFDRLRKEYPRRREFHNTRAVVLPPNAEIGETLASLGFTS
jgi:erythronate-4-phosphate dehydrogenase